MNLPDNKKFGFLFFIFFLICSSIQSFNQSYVSAYSLAVLSALFFIITIVNADLLIPLYKLWMRLGFLLQRIISPVVLVIIFFTLITPIAILMRILRRDELRLRIEDKKTYWRVRKGFSEPTSFKNQF